MDVKHGHSQDVKSIAWHPTQELLVSCSYDNSIKLWMNHDGDWDCVQTLEGGPVSWSPRACVCTCICLFVCLICTCWCAQVCLPCACAHVCIQVRC